MYFVHEQIQDMIGSMEREKYELQKGHTKSIQDLLEDTNQRLTNMEDEYNSQSQATVGFATITTDT